jgi:hypothetical protein
LHIILEQFATPNRSISHPLITVSTDLPTGRDIIACHVRYPFKKFLHSTQLLQ